MNSMGPRRTVAQLEPRDTGRGAQSRGGRWWSMCPWRSTGKLEAREISSPPRSTVELGHDGGIAQERKDASRKAGPQKNSGA
ncbi:hypothetical protein E2562_034052 [Oryza meyeriana var. granulata]|uniref:Uncharacterized protein n=1 Tax=Oryza meyeriana var. granulata TaxID=110450 RepID=A0A6G1C909_9ORYZ|nr:hypothetical protein E2562_034052 [Oryza meyeriana var. granulata]